MVSGGSIYNPIVAQIAPAINLNIPDNFYKLFGRGTEESRNTYYRELKEMIFKNFRDMCEKKYSSFICELFGEYNKGLKFFLSFDKFKLKSELNIFFLLLKLLVLLFLTSLSLLII